MVARVAQEQVFLQKLSSSSASSIIYLNREEFAVVARIN
jgi:hypothetical protein